MSNGIVAAIALPFEGRENLRGALWASVAAHAVLAGLMLGWGLLHFGRGAGWGNPWEKGSSARVQAVASLPGVPLPSPMRVTPNVVANDNPGLYQTEPPPLPVSEIAEQIPKFKDAVKPEEKQADKQEDSEAGSDSAFECCSFRRGRPSRRLLQSVYDCGRRSRHLFR